MPFATIRRYGCDTSTAAMSTHGHTLPPGAYTATSGLVVSSNM